MLRVNFSSLIEHSVNGESVLEMDDFETALDDVLKEIDIDDSQKEDDFQAYLDKVVSEYEEAKVKEETAFTKALNACLNSNACDFNKNE